MTIQGCVLQALDCPLTEASIEFNQSTVRLAWNPCGFEATVRRATVTVCESCNTCLVPEVRYLIIGLGRMQPR